MTSPSLLSPRRALAAALLLLGGSSLACMPPRPHRGDINLVYGLTGEQRTVFEVEQGRVLSGNLDIATESDAKDSCVRGLWQHSSVSLCPAPLASGDSHLGGELVRWRGPNGELSVEVAPNGSAMRVDGWIARNSGAGVASADASSHSGIGGGGNGGGRRGSSFTGDPSYGAPSGPQRMSMHVTLPLGVGPEWDELRRTPILYALAAASVGLNSGERVQPWETPAQERGQRAGPPPAAPSGAAPPPAAPPPAPPPAAPNAP